MYAVNVGYRIIKLIENEGKPMNEVKIRRNIDGHLSIDQILCVINNMIKEKYLDKTKLDNSVAYRKGKNAENLVKSYEKLMETMNSTRV
jgi:hypothetical protein